nr:GIY-YIG nuclease family protein [Evansella caseinilytica]
MPERNIADQLYLLVLKLESTCSIVIGKRGQLYFQAGMYVYVGSAKRNIESRIARHLQQDKKKRWHLDYFRPHAEVLQVFTLPLHNGECALKEFIQQQCIGRAVGNKFGASDCRCDSHLLKIPGKISDTPEKLKEKWLACQGKKLESSAGS